MGSVRMWAAWWGMDLGWPLLAGAATSREGRTSTMATNIWGEGRRVDETCESGNIFVILEYYIIKVRNIVGQGTRYTHGDLNKHKRFAHS